MSEGIKVKTDVTFINTLPPTSTNNVSRVEMEF